MPTMSTSDPESGICLAYKFRLAPTFEQRVRLWQCAEMARWAWNWTLRLCEDEYVDALVAAGVLDRADLETCARRKQRIAVLAKARSRAKAEGKKLARPSINRGRLYKEWCVMRDTTMNSIKGFHSHTYSYPIERVVKAYKNFWAGRSSAPRSHGCNHASSFTIQLQRQAWREGELKIPGVGWMATTWKDRGSLRGECPLQRIPTGKPCSITVTRRADYWYASVAMKNVEADSTKGSGVVGVDLGVGALLTTSDGERVLPPRPLEVSLRLLSRRQRQFQRKTKGSRRRTLLNIKIARLHHRVAQIRADHLHCVTTDLARRYETVVVEGFNVRTLVSDAVGYRKRRREIMDLGWGEARRQLQYKLQWRGGELLVAPQFHPTNQQCSSCWSENTISFNECPPSQPIYSCSVCGAKKTRQANTADLLKSFGTGHWPPEGTGAQPGPDARGGSNSTTRGVDPLNREHAPSRAQGSSLGPALLPNKKRTQDQGFATSVEACKIHESKRPTRPKKRCASQALETEKFTGA